MSTATSSRFQRRGGATWTSATVGVVLGVMIGLGQPARARAEIATFGVKAGLAAAGQHGATSFEGNRTGIGVGFMAGIPLSPRVSLQPEALYVQKGAKTTSELTNSVGVVIGTESVTYAIDYVEIPLLLRVGVPTDGSVEPYFIGGPSVGFKVSEEIRFGDFSDPQDRVSTTDFGLAIGAGLQVGRGGSYWLIEGRYTAGVTDIGSIPDGSLRSGVWLVTAGIAWQP